MNIDGDYYIFNFEKTNISSFWSMKITDINGSPVNITPRMIGLKDMSECSRHNKLFTGKSGTYVYLINMKLNESSIDYYDDLRNFVFLITKVDMQEWNALVMDIISNALTV